MIFTRSMWTVLIQPVVELVRPVLPGTTRSVSVRFCLFSLSLPCGPEIQQPLSEWNNRRGSESSILETDIYVWRCTLLVEGYWKSHWPSLPVTYCCCTLLIPYNDRQTDNRQINHVKSVLLIWDTYKENPKNQEPKVLNNTKSKMVNVQRQETEWSAKQQN